MRRSSPARPTTRRAGIARPRASPLRAGSPSTSAGGCRGRRLAADEQDRARSAPPSSRSQRAQFAAAMPTADQQVVYLASGHARRRRRAGLVKRSVTPLLDADVEHEQHLVAGLDDRVARGHEAGASRRIEITSEPSGRPSPAPACRPPRTPATSSSMISRFSWGRSSRCTRPYCGTSCSIRRRIRSVADTAGLMPSSSKCWRLRGLLQLATIRPPRTSPSRPGR